MSALMKTSQSTTSTTADMFPDVKGLNASIEANTEVQRDMIVILGELTSEIGRMTLQMEELTLLVRENNKQQRSTRTNSTGPK